MKKTLTSRTLFLLIGIFCGILYMVILESEVKAVGVCYNKLFKLLIDKNMKKGDLCTAARVSPSSLAKLRNGENVNTDIIVKICHVLKCEPGDIMELSRAEQTNQIQEAR